jgi:hypothetical protein
VAVDGVLEEKIGLRGGAAAHAKHFGRIKGALLVGKREHWGGRTEK